ncbi:ribonuclease III [bacterium]|nr:ribonuclease III [bacterium]
MNTKQKNNARPTDAVEKIIGYSFKKKQTLITALTHRSYANELRKQGFQYNNERLEFLGDAVLEIVVSDYLYRTYEELPEGIMTLVRAAVVKTTSLAEEVAKMKLGEFLILGHGEEKTGGRTKEYLLANLYESLVGAIYLDGGMKKASEFIENTLFEKIKMTVTGKNYTDSKTRLQEIAQQHYKVTPTYTIIQESGPAHERIYVAAVHIGDKQLSEGSGSSKQKAEDAAAEKALGLLDKLTEDSHAQN